MKTLQRITYLMALAFVLASCGTGSAADKALATTEDRQEVMANIANDSSMSNEMMGVLMDGKYGSMVMMEHHDHMMRMMKEEPGMMKSMMNDMMDRCMDDTTIMTGVCKRMMSDPKMRIMMRSMEGKKMSLDSMKRIDLRMDL